MHIAETDEQARLDCEYGFEQIWSWLGQIGPLPTLSATNLKEQIAEVAESGPIMIGTPDKAIELICRLTEQAGGFGTFVMTIGDFGSPEAQQRSVELFAKYVIPAFRGQLDAPIASRKWVLGAKDTDEATIWKTQSLGAAAEFVEQYQQQRAADPA
jgi:limonene 1,2-monooxygenase